MRWRIVVSDSSLDACATGIVVRVAFSSDRLGFVVRDDGCGVGEATEGTGRAGMRERAEGCGGGLTVRSAAEGGTAVEGWAPLA